MRTYGSALASLLLVATTANGQSAGTFVPVTDSMLQNPDPADWLMWRRTLDLWGYSPLIAIDRSNVGALKMVWTRALGPGIQEGTPLVYDGVMYFPNPSDLVQALDAATGDLKWEYRRSLPSDLGEYFPVPSINRNLAIYGDTLIDTSADDYLYALDARTGALRWEVQLFDYRRGAQHTSGPRAALPVPSLFGRLDAKHDAARRVARVRLAAERALLRQRVEIAVRPLHDVPPTASERHEQRVAPLCLRHRLIERHSQQRLAVERADEEMPFPRLRACRRCTT